MLLINHTMWLCLAKGKLAQRQDISNLQGVDIFFVILSTRQSPALFPIRKELWIEIRATRTGLPRLSLPFALVRLFGGLRLRERFMAGTEQKLLVLAAGFLREKFIKTIILTQNVLLNLQVFLQGNLEVRPPFS